VYLNRLADSGRIQKIKRGQYKGVTNVTTVTSKEDNDITEITECRNHPGGRVDVAEQLKRKATARSTISIL
jgi:hypothetical protein